MLVTPHTYQQLGILERNYKRKGNFLPDTGWLVAPDAVRNARSMLLVHQVGSVRIGEVVRYVHIYIISELCLLNIAIL